MEVLIPTFFCIGVLVWLGLRELRKWIEVCVNVGSNDDQTQTELSDSVKHMYN
jgi:hypothetical protein